jgi:hypothetical protein
MVFPTPCNIPRYITFIAYLTIFAALPVLRILNMHLIYHTRKINPAVVFQLLHKWHLLLVIWPSRWRDIATIWRHMTVVDVTSDAVTSYIPISWCQFTFWRRPAFRFDVRLARSTHARSTTATTPHVRSAQQQQQQQYSISWQFANIIARCFVRITRNLRAHWLLAYTNCNAMVQPFSLRLHKSQDCMRCRELSIEACPACSATCRTAATVCNWCFVASWQEMSFKLDAHEYCLSTATKRTILLCLHIRRHINTA